MRFYLATALFFFCFSLSAQLAKDTPLKGTVRYVLEESFEGVRKETGIVKSGKSRQFSWMQDNEMEFDRNHNLIKRSFYDDERNPLHSELYSFVNNRLMKKEFQAFTYLYRYDDNSHVKDELSISKTDTNDLKLKQRFLYDESGKLLEAWEYDMKGGHVRHQKNQYDTSGKLTKETIKYKDSVEYKTYAYNIAGLLEKVEWFDFQLGLLERITYTYASGYLHKEFWENFEEGKVESTTAFEYDRHGNPISILEINPKRQIHDHEINTYVYDEFNNWTKKTTAINNSRFYVVERQIRYYI